jgi:hypothetical protein
VLNSQHSTAHGTQESTRQILRSLFPSWLPGAFKACTHLVVAPLRHHDASEALSHLGAQVMFSRPMPALSCRLNAWVTALTCQWLMGPCQINDVEVDGGTVGRGQGVLVERWACELARMHISESGHAVRTCKQCLLCRCRYLEETGCASVCLNSCKVPTQVRRSCCEICLQACAWFHIGSCVLLQEFFARDMGLPLTMTPNYDDASCQFSFGATPKPWHDDDAFQTACFVQCPTKQRHREKRCPGAVEQPAFLA